MRKISIKLRILGMVSIFTLTLILLAATSLLSQWNSYKRSDQLLSIVDETRQAQVDFKIQVQEWKNTLIRGQDTKQFNKYWKRVQDRATLIEKELLTIKHEFEILNLDTSLIDSTLKEYKIMMTKYTEGLSKYNSSDITSIQTVDKHVSGVDRQINTNLDKIVADFTQYAHDTSYQSTIALIKLLSIITLLVIAAFTVISKLFIDSIRHPIANLENALDKLAAYQLSFEIDETGNDEISQMAQKTSHLRKALSELVHKINQSSVDISSATTELSATTDAMNNMIDQQNNSVKQILIATEDSSQNINRIKEHSNNTSGNLNEIINSAKDVDNSIQALEVRSGEIVEVTSIIQDITDQINLLALNAAIEAARAGDAGRGFAVVADEVRKLANNTNESTKRISSVITSLTQEVSSTSDNVVRITSSVNQITSGVSSVSEALEQQSAATEEITATVQEFSQNMDSVSRNASETNVATQNISDQAIQMQDEVKKFKL